MAKALICLAAICALACAQDSQNDWQKPDQLIRALQLKRSDAVAVLEPEPFLAPRITDRVRVVVNHNDPAAPAHSVDVIVLYDALHSVEHRAEFYPKLRHLLRPGGRVVNIDFFADPPSSGAREPKLPDTQAVREFTAAGFHITQSVALLQFQYFQVFE
jgi:hypothetical protein